MGFSALLWGFAVLALFSKIENTDYEKPWIVFVLGLAALTFYAEIFSLFYRVNLEANIGVLIIDILVFIFMRRDIFFLAKKWIFSNKARLTGFCFLCFSCCLCASMPVLNGDTYLYQGQAIHWITDYGVVKGLGNINTRFAFNSAFLCLQALFSVPFATGGTALHSANGFIVWIFLCYALLSMKSFRSSKLYISDFARLGMIIFMISMVNKFSSTDTNLFALGLAAFIVCEWITLIEVGSREIPQYALLIILIAFDITLKLTTAFLLILIIWPVYILIKEKNWKRIAVYFVCGLVLIIPFLVRNYFISGWLVYPLDGIDIFKADWKIPADTLASERVRCGNINPYFFVIVFMAAVGVAIDKLLKKKKYNTVVKAVMAAVMILCAIPFAQYGRYERAIIFKPYDYNDYDSKSYKFHSKTMYVPENNENMNYYDFPAIQNYKIFSLIEFRGKDFSEGFRAVETKNDLIKLIQEG